MGTENTSQGGMAQTGFRVRGDVIRDAMDRNNEAYQLQQLEERRQQQARRAQDIRTAGNNRATRTARQVPGSAPDLAPSPTFNPRQPAPVGGPKRNSPWGV